MEIVLNANTLHELHDQIEPSPFVAVVVAGVVTFCLLLVRSFPPLENIHLMDDVKCWSMVVRNKAFKSSIKPSMVSCKVQKNEK